MDVQNGSSLHHCSLKIGLGLLSTGVIPTVRDNQRFELLKLEFVVSSDL
jgi:hypothetical protein